MWFWKENNVRKSDKSDTFKIIWGRIFQIFEITFDNEFRLKKFKKSESSHFQTKLQILPEN